MDQVTEIEIKNRLSADNPWWATDGTVDPKIVDWPRRAYFEPFSVLVRDTSLKRAVVLMGPRRVGKTVMLQQLIQDLLQSGVLRTNILYISLDNPTYMGLGLEKILTLYREHTRHESLSDKFVLFDEIQYLRDWEIHLKSLVDSYPETKFVGSGSSAAALRLKSRESGAGRFTDFLLPPLTFAEYLDFRAIGSGVEHYRSIDELNDEFINYLNFGGFPEAIISDTVRADFQRHIGSDIIDKVLLRDLPSLYGIQDTQELNRLFATLAYNTGNEISLAELSQGSGVAKNTIIRYLEYLEAAFLVCRIHRIDESARRFRRATNFKIYLTIPCLRAALFGPVRPGDEAMGRLAETAIVSQFLHGIDVSRLYYARWRKGQNIREVDLVVLDSGTQKPFGAMEIKWSDRQVSRLEELEGLAEFLARHPNISYAHVYTKSERATVELSGQKVEMVPVSSRCRFIGTYSTVRSIDRLLESVGQPDDPNLASPAADAGH